MTATTDPIEVLRHEIESALRELDNVTADTDEHADRIGCAENALNRALAALASLSAPKHNPADNMEAGAGHVQGSEWVLVPREPTKEMVMAGGYLHPDQHGDAGKVYTAMLASAPKPESAEAVIPWVREWKGSGTQRGFHIREATRLHNNRVVAYLGDKVDGDEVDKLIAEHNGKHPNGDPVRPAPPRPEARDGEVVAHGFYDPVTGAYDETQRTPRWLPAVVCTAPQQASAPVGVERKYPDDGNGDEDAYNLGWNECIDTIASVSYDGPYGVRAAWGRITAGNGFPCDYEVVGQALAKIALAQQPAAVDEADKEGQA